MIDIAVAWLALVFIPVIAEVAHDMHMISRNQTPNHKWGMAIRSFLFIAIGLSYVAINHDWLQGVLLSIVSWSFHFLVFNLILNWIRDKSWNHYNPSLWWDRLEGSMPIPMLFFKVIILFASVTTYLHPEWLLGW